MHAIHIREFGGPEVLTWTELPDPAPAPGEALVRLGVAGVNYVTPPPAEAGDFSLRRVGVATDQPGP
jgi:hypothetical protein